MIYDGTFLLYKTAEILFANTQPNIATTMRLLPILLLVVVTSTAVAQNDSTYSTRGFSVGLHLNGTSWHLDEPDFNLDGSDSGGGLGLDLSYGVSDLVSIFLNLDGASIDPDDGETYTLGHADLGARFAFGSTAKKFKPFAQVAFTGVVAEQEFGMNTLELSGGGLTLGGGILYFFSPAVALDTGLRLTIGQLTEVKLNNVSVDTEIDAQTSRFDVGIRWYPGR